jgi:hypothetical protein
VGSTRLTKADKNSTEAGEEFGARRIVVGTATVAGSQSFHTLATVTFETPNSRGQ